MFKKTIVLGILLVGTLAVSAAPTLAQTTKDSIRIEKLEERVRDLEARTAKVEASSNKQMAQMGMEKHSGHDTMKQGMGMNNPMGQAPQQIPQGNAPQAAPGNNMPAGGAPMGGDM